MESHGAGVWATDASELERIALRFSDRNVFEPSGRLANKVKKWACLAGIAGSHFVMSGYCAGLRLRLRRKCRRKCESDYGMLDWFYPSCGFHS
jgi:hypothetical protein